MVASNLNDDHDLCRFTLVCRQARNFMDGKGGFQAWRSQFGDKFDLPPGPQRPALKEEYFNRCKTLNKPVHFHRGNTREEQDCLLWIRDVVKGKRFIILEPHGYSRLL